MFRLVTEYCKTASAMIVLKLQTGTEKVEAQTDYNMWYLTDKLSRHCDTRHRSHEHCLMLAIQCRPVHNENRVLALEIVRRAKRSSTYLRLRGLQRDVRVEWAATVISKLSGSVHISPSSIPLSLKKYLNDTAAGNPKWVG